MIIKIINAKYLQNMKMFTFLIKIKRSIISKMSFIIKGEKIFLRNVLIKDANVKYLKWLSDKKINQYLETRHYKQSIKPLPLELRESSKDFLIKSTTADPITIPSHACDIKVA